MSEYRQRDTSPRSIDLEDGEGFGETAGLEVSYQVDVRFDDTADITLETIKHVEVSLQQCR